MDGMDIDALLAQRVRDLRKANGLTLAQLSERSGVSRSTISLIERQETSPTAAVLNKLADALGIAMPTLFAVGVPPSEQPLARRAVQPVWKDPASGYVRRHLSPALAGAPLELVEVTFPPGATVVFDRPASATRLHQQLWIMEGAMHITLDSEAWHLAEGDCLALTAGGHLTFHNPDSAPARYLLAITSHHSPARTF